MIQNTDKVSNKQYVGITELKRTSQDTIDKVLNLYAEGRSQLYIEKELKMTRRTIRGILLKHDRIRGRQEQQSVHAHTFTSLREDAFDIVTDEMAYWLGFLYADGYITKPTGKKYLGILLKGEDINHLEKFKEWLKAPQKIFTGSTTLNEKVYPNAGIHIGSLRLYNKLVDWGITCTKSYDAKCPEAMKYNRHFWRGMIDGDGYIGLINSGRKERRKRLHLCGTFDMMESFLNFIITCGVTTEAKVRKERNHFTMQVGDLLALKIATVLYKDSTVSLDRKYKKYLEFIN